MRVEKNLETAYIKKKGEKKLFISLFPIGIPGKNM